MTGYDKIIDGSLCLDVGCWMWGWNKRKRYLGIIEWQKLDGDGAR